MQIVKQTRDKPTKSGHKKLLAEPDIRRRYQNIARESTMTADVRLRRFGVYCERADTTSKEFVQTGIDNLKNADDVLQNLLSKFFYLN